MIELEKKLILKIKQQPLTLNQIYQEFAFESVEHIDSALNNLKRYDVNPCCLIDGYFQLDRTKRVR